MISQYTTWKHLYIFLYKDDISRNKTASQSHTYVGPVGTKLYDASNAVDGNPATCMRTKPIGTNSPDKMVWWKVDIGGVFNIYRINILFKKYDESVGEKFYENHFISH